MLTKGSIVSVFGHVGINAFKDMSGDFHAYLTFHANSVKLISKGSTQIATTSDEPNEITKDDLPF